MASKNEDTALRPGLCVRAPAAGRVGPETETEDMEKVKEKTAHIVGITGFLAIMLALFFWAGRRERNRCLVFITEDVELFIVDGKDSHLYAFNPDRPSLMNLGRANCMELHTCSELRYAGTVSSGDFIVKELRAFQAVDESFTIEDYRAQREKARNKWWRKNPRIFHLMQFAFFAALVTGIPMIVKIIVGLIRVRKP